MIRKPVLRRRRVRSKSSSPSSVDVTQTRIRKWTVNTLRFVWVLAVFYGEYGWFRRSVGRCRWMDDGIVIRGSNSSGRSKGKGKESPLRGDRPFHLLIVADPQILDMHSYPERPYPLRLLSQWIVDNFLRKNWKMAKRRLKPDGVVFLGDLMDSGIEVGDRDEYAQYTNRFHSIFPPPPSLLTHPLFLPGNHDLGLHTSPGRSSFTRERFANQFGNLNGKRKVAGWEWVWVDSMGLVEEWRRKRVGNEEGEGEVGQDGVVIAAEGGRFLEEFEKDRGSLPRILFSHIPLWRDEGSPCGDRREASRPIHQGAGRNYQNEMDKDVSERLLDAVQPWIVYSGDDHDGCDIVHPRPTSSQPMPSNVPGGIHEISVKSASMAMGIRRPGYELVSFYNPTFFTPPSSQRQQLSSNNMSSPQLFTSNCGLPDQVSIYLNFYLPLLMFSLFILFVPNAYRSFIKSGRSTSARTNGLSLPNTRSKESSSFATRKEISEDSDSDLLEGGYTNVTAGSFNTEGEEEDDFDMTSSPIFSSSPISRGGNEYAYHSPVDYDGGLNSSSYPGLGSLIGVGRPKRPKNHVRRVSRVWLWDGTGRSQQSSSSSSLVDDDSLPSTSLLSIPVVGPIYRYIFRPFLRLVRGLWRKVFGLRLVRRCLRTVGLAGEVGKVRKGVVLRWVSDVLDVAVVALLVFASVWVWFVF